MGEEAFDILLVEDNRDIANLVRSTLESEGYRVRVESDGLAALRAVQQSRPHLLLLDLMLPELDGLELCERIRGLTPREPYLPILMLTALDAQSYKALGFARGADDYITKPFDIDDLVARVHVWGRASVRIRELYDLRQRWETERQAAQDQAVRHMALAIPEAVNESVSEIYGYAEQLANRPDVDPEVREMCARVREATQRLVATLDRLANVSHYVTKLYGTGVQVLDVERAAEKPEEGAPSRPG